MKVLYKKNQVKTMRKEGGYSVVFFRKRSGKIRFSGKLQNDPRKLQDEVRELLG